MKFLLGFVDRLLFAAALIVGLQIPEFVTQYTQRFAAEHQRVTETLARDDDYRRRNASADADLMFAVLEPATRAQLETQAARQQQTLAVMTRGSLAEKLLFLARALDRPTADAIRAQMTPRLPWQLDAWLCGLALAALATVTFQIARGVVGLGIALLQALRRHTAATTTPRSRPADARRAPVLNPGRREPRAL